MKILIIGGNGTVGKPVTSYLSQSHEVLLAGRNSGDYLADLKDTASLHQLFAETGKLDAIVSIAGEAKWAPFDELSEEDYHIGLQSKLMGQVNLTRIGKDFLNPNGSITLSTGILADFPVRQTASAAMVNGAIHSFVKAAALEFPPGLRLNVVSLGLVEDAFDKYKDYFPGHNPIPTSRVINAYLKSILGHDHGQIIRDY